ncbi:hypothetical protein QBC42DRAFT_212739 [Cladorrhinum samala]|uniref:DUF2423 domain-containing protein n=1 Tax=Cladorrhinum samala TaxID=585594 RepID=A0AAV9HA36_9PEZI|nr:hypothetical protein QBC42DRAFT_212739 [Cladorrhinum samala]
MGKSSRASTIKQNNQKLKKNVFGPVEQARAERLYAKMAELVAAPKPVKEVEMADEAEEEAEQANDVAAEEEEAAMEVDGAKSEKPKKKLERKRRGKKSNIVFRKKGPKVTKAKK